MDDLTNLKRLPLRSGTDQTENDTYLKIKTEITSIKANENEPIKGEDGITNKASPKFRLKREHINVECDSLPKIKKEADEISNCDVKYSPKLETRGIKLGKACTNDTKIPGNWEKVLNNLREMRKKF
ncbi:hypothetical protein NQ317_012601 [Molorchus minor]|uniref:Uncharacterized protein n=1 Tax=Molorchus minor TaxID=1323400 RepID=A0ABQ9JL81_9CUCU|nr:hypothetical protein NQ317_012601 [Molorchus minor]